MDKNKLFHRGIEQSSLFYIIVENILLISMFAIAFWGMLPLTILGLPIISISYLIFAIIMLGFVLRKHLCTHCYYYNKWCHCGWGKLASLFFEKESGNYDFAKKIALPTWGILMGLPIPIMIAMLILKKIPMWTGGFILLTFMTLVFINSLLHKRDCCRCKMRFICPGSAASKNGCDGCS